jgi:hypothetical protein
MKSISGKIFIAKVKVDRPQEDGLMKSVKEEYACKAVNFTDCEAKITKEVGSADNIKGSFDILSETIAPFKEVFIFDEGDIFYKVKIQESYLDDFGKEKKINYFYLLNATSFEQARKNIVEALGETMKDYTIAAVVEQKTLEVFE